MSLSFVSSSVLSSTDGVSHNEEVQIQSTELDVIRQRNASDSKPLYEQLRSNQEQEAERQAEEERARIRGTLALDEEDVAHLDALNRSKLRSELERKAELEREVAMFRAAKEERVLGHVVAVVGRDDERNDGKDNNFKLNQGNDAETRGDVLPSFNRNSSLAVPITTPSDGYHSIRSTTLSNLVIKHKRPRNEFTASSNHKRNKSEIQISSAPVEATLGDLLGAYSSSSDED